MLTKVNFILVFIVVLLITSCASPETTTTTSIKYTQYEVIDKNSAYNPFGVWSSYFFTVRVDNNETDRFRVDRDFYYQYEIGDFFYEKRVVLQGKIDDKELLPGKHPGYEE